MLSFDVGFCCGRLSLMLKCPKTLISYFAKCMIFSPVPRGMLTRTCPPAKIRSLARARHDYDFSAWPNKSDWSNQKVLDAVRSVKKSQVPNLYEPNIHFDPYFNTKDRAELSMYLASKKYGVAAAIEILKKLPKRIAFAEKYECENSKKKDKIFFSEISGPVESYTLYQKLVNQNSSVEKKHVFRMLEKASLYKKNGSRISSNEDTSYADYILENEGSKVTKDMMEGYFFGILLQADSPSKAKDFYIKNLTFGNGDLFSDYYYLHAVRNFASWFGTKQNTALQVNVILRMFSERNILPSCELMNEMLISSYHNEELFLDILDEMNYNKMDFLFQSFVVIDKYYRAVSEELRLQYMKLFVSDYLNRRKLFVDVTVNMDESIRYLKQISEELFERNMWNYASAFFFCMCAKSCWEALHPSDVSYILDNFLKIETSPKQFLETLDKLKVSGVPKELESKSLGLYLRAFAMKDLDYFFKCCIALDQLFDNFRSTEHISDLIEIMLDVLLRENNKVSAESAEKVILFLNNILAKFEARKLKVKANDNYMLLNLITNNKAMALAHLKMGSMRAVRKSEMDTAVMNIIRENDDFYFVQDVIHHYQRYFLGAAALL